MDAAVAARIKSIEHGLETNRFKLDRANIKDMHDADYAPSEDPQFKDPSAVTCLVCGESNRVINLARSKMCPTHGWVCAPCSTKNIDACPLCRGLVKLMVEVNEADVSALRSRVAAAEDAAVETNVDLMIALMVVRDTICGPPNPSTGKTRRLTEEETEKVGRLNEEITVLEGATEASGRAWLIKGRAVDDPELRRAYFELGASLGSALCKYEITKIESDPRRRRKLLVEAANGNCTGALITLGQEAVSQLTTATSSDVTAAIHEEMKFMTIAAKLGNPHAMMTLAKTQFEVDKDNFLAVYWAAVAHFRYDHPEALGLLQEWLDNNPQPIALGDPMDRLRQLAMVDGYIEAASAWLTPL